MSSNGEDTRDAHESSSAAGAAGGTDIVRDLLLGLAANIDTIAAMFAPSGHPASRPPVRDRATHGTSSGPIAGAAASSTPGSFGAAPSGGHGGQVPIGDYLAEASGEIASLLAELGDLLARLLSALIAVLEAVVRALQSAPAQPAGPRPQSAYSPISVRIDRGSAAHGARGTYGFHDTAGGRAHPEPGVIGVDPDEET
ncbi:MULTISPECIES: hypothetical protein [Gordonia]|jgi:hypothetical protein|uniref:hypothetical protein n=1 Tax=Gordonia TaxID=2053 RepID=UPI001FE5F3B7|nr:MULTISPECIES: hypothetical protein [Gordonia]